MHISGERNYSITQDGLFLVYNKPVYNTQPLIAAAIEDFSFVEMNVAADRFPVKDDNIKKMDAADLFAYFTANIIKEDVLFVR